MYHNETLKESSNMFLKELLKKSQVMLLLISLEEYLTKEICKKIWNIFKGIPVQTFEEILRKTHTKAF